MLMPALPFVSATFQVWTPGGTHTASVYWKEKNQAPHRNRQMANWHRKAPDIICHEGKMNYNSNELRLQAARMTERPRVPAPRFGGLSSSWSFHKLLLRKGKGIISQRMIGQPPERVNWHLAFWNSNSTPTYLPSRNENILTLQESWRFDSENSQE